MWDSVFVSHPWVSYIVCFLVIKFYAIKKGYFFGKETKAFNEAHAEDGNQAFDTVLNDEVVHDPEYKEEGSANTTAGGSCTEGVKK